MKKTARLFRAIVTTTIIVAASAGCHSGARSHAATDDPSADRINDNRLLLRMAFAENVYNGVAAERAVYPRDFDAGSSLNELGKQRVAMLADASRNASGSIVVIRGDEADDVYDARIAAVRKELADAGLDLKQLTIAKGGPVAGEGNSSERAILTYSRMMSEYAPRQGAGAGGGSKTMTFSSGTSNNQRGQ